MAEAADRPASPRLVLASASPRRLELLRLAGLEPEVRPADIDERPHPGEPPASYVARLAREKAERCAHAPDEVVLAADTTVAVDGEPLGKARDADEAEGMLRRLSGRRHTVRSGVAVVADGAVTDRVVSTDVWMAALTDAEIAAYVATGEPIGKAGGYAIQGRAAVLVARIDGSWTNVVGLPMVETRELLRAAGVTR